MLNSEIGQQIPQTINIQPLSPQLLGDMQVVSYQDYSQNMLQISNILNSLIQNNSKSTYRIAQNIGNLPISSQVPTVGQKLTFNGTEWIPE